MLAHTDQYLWPPHSLHRLVILHCPSCRTDQYSFLPPSHCCCTAAPRFFCTLKCDLPATIRQQLDLPHLAQDEPREDRVVLEIVHEVAPVLAIDVVEGVQRVRVDAGRRHLRHAGEDAAGPVAACPLLLCTVPFEQVLARAVRVQLEGEHAGGWVIACLPCDQTSAHAGELVPAELAAGEPGIAEMVEALPVDDGGVRCVC
ncbi:Os01g0870750 [Oryza sativa Japonica Group]|uniref:Os01g0870750 protein n=1 Tax=Oryza sativa subsp. japonica TaxID=39947 RepID=A0A0N7KE51_ORYSJ|nr:hypothetical protein EE612_007064 [Oryza sativa]BAS75441.1 Os01g0870750 [Oryza sativa Japonica Group]